MENINSINPFARLWHTKSADLGDAWAMHSLGRFAETGRGDVPLDLKVALDWYEKSVAAGLGPAKVDVEQIKAQLSTSPQGKSGEPVDAVKDATRKAVEAAKDATKDAVKKP